MKHRCEQCGREGTREFTTLGGFWAKLLPQDNEVTWVPFVTVCANSRDPVMAFVERTYGSSDERKAA